MSLMNEPVAQPEPTWDDRILALLRDVVDHFAGTDAPLGMRAQRLLIEHLESAPACEHRWDGPSMSMDIHPPIVSTQCSLCGEWTTDNPWKDGRA